ncbi:MAG: DUF2007 domain-containing protein [Pseudomonadota bacterium]
MVVVYSGSSALESHMVLNLLHSYGIEGQIEGEHLQGGVGELPAMDIVRVLVENAEADRAMRVIDEWQEENPVEVAVGDSRVRHDYAAFFLVFVVGVVVGVAVMLFAQ